MEFISSSEPESRAEEVWGVTEWAERERRTRVRALRASSEPAAWRVVVRESRAVMRSYTTSFFIVSRFLPAAKRDEVEAVVGQEIQTAFGEWFEGALIDAEVDVDPRLGTWDPATGEIARPGAAPEEPLPPAGTDDPSG